MQHVKVIGFPVMKVGVDDGIESAVYVRYSIAATVK